MQQATLRRYRKGAVALAVTGLLVAATQVGGSAVAAGHEPPKPHHSHEVVTWGASADRTGGHVTDQTVRDIVHTSIAGTGVRVSVTNVFGSQAVTFDDVYVGRQQSGASVVPGSNRRLTFSGEQSITIPAGAEALSDPLPGTLPAQANLAISLHLQGTSGTVTGHNLATQTSYVSTSGDHAAEESGAAYTTQISNWYFVDAVVVDEGRTVHTVATLGDSITDGFRSTPNANHRWPDYLARRLLAHPRPRQLGVMNEGISGNKVLADGAGVSAQARFDRDVLSQPDVETVILLEGINDIGGGVATSADQLISAYRQLIARAHSEGTCIIGGTMTPFEGAGYYSEQKEVIREAANEFIRHSGEFDGVVDFDRATRDPADPKRFLPAYDSGDHLHPNDAGYQAMAAAVDLEQLDCQLTRP